MQLPPGTTECNLSYYTRNSFSASHTVLQLQNLGTANSVQPLTHTQQANGTASSGSVSSPPLPWSTISSQVPVCPIRNDTGDVMPLAQAITQLSFLEFLQHCGVPLAPPQPSQLPVPISLLDAAVQTNPPGDVFQDVSTQTSDQQDTLSCDVAVQTTSHGTHILSLDAAAQTTSPSTLSRHVSTQMGSRLASSFSVDVFVQTPVRSVVLHDVAIQLPTTEFFIGCVFSNDPLDRQNSVRQSPSSVQDDIGSDLSSLTCTITRPNLGCVDIVRKLAPRALLQPPPGLEQLAPPSGLATGSHLYTTHGAAISDAPSRARLRSATSDMPTQPSACSTHTESHHLRSATIGKRSASTAMVGTHNLANTDACAESVPFPKPRALVLPLVHFGQSKPDGHTGLDTADSDLMHHQFRLSLLQWNPGQARKYPSHIVSAACGKFHAVILQEASDHVPHIFDQFMAFTDNTDLAILLNKDTFEPDPIVNSFKADSTSKGTWGMILLIVRGFLRRPSITGSPTVTFCSVHIHNVVAKKRDASTDLLQRLHGYMREHNVDFIGGDFNMSAFSTVGDVFTDEEFSAPGNSLLWGLGALEEPNRECAGFLIMPKRPYEWRVHSHGCYKFDNALLGLGPRDQSAHLPVFLHLRNTNLPGPSSIMRSDQAQQRRLERRHDKESMQRRRSSRKCT